MSSKLVRAVSRATDMSNQMDDKPWSTEAKVIIWMIYMLIAFGNMVGNGLVIWIVLRNQRMRTVTNYFLVNLAFADFLTVFHILPNVYYTIEQQWVFGEAYCRFSQFFTPFNISISALTFLALSADRYLAILFPLRARPKSKRIICSIIVVWLLSLFIGLPVLIRSRVDLRKRCVFDVAPYWSGLYDWSVLVVLYIVPLIIIVAFFIPIAIRLWHHRGLGECTRYKLDSMRSKRKVVKMLIIVIAIFAACSLPYQSFFLIHGYITEDSVTSYYFWAAYALMMVQAMCNPIIYFCMNKRFKKSLLNIFPCLKCCCKVENTNKVISQCPITQVNKQNGTASFPGHNESRIDLSKLS